MNALIVMLSVAVAKNVSGWLKNAVEDGEVSTYEWRQLVITVLTTAVIFWTTYGGLAGLGFDDPSMISGLVSLVVGQVWDAVAKKL